MYQCPPRFVWEFIYALPLAFEIDDEQ
jgi:hypothetical protein